MPVQPQIIQKANVLLWAPSPARIYALKQSNYKDKLLFKRQHLPKTIFKCFQGYKHSVLFSNKHCYDIVVHHHRKQCVIKPANTPWFMRSCFYRSKEPI